MAAPMRKFGDFTCDELQLIFDHLSVKDRLHCALVCKQWLRVTNQRRHLSDICVVFENRRFVVPKSRAFRHFRFEECGFDEPEMRLLEELGDQVSLLLFNNCKFERALKMDGFCELESLGLCEGENVTFSLDSTLKSLTSLSIRQPTLTDDQLVTLCDRSPKLRQLRVRVEDLLSMPQVESHIRPDALLHCIKTRCATLKILVLDFDYVDSSTLVAISNIQGLNLQELSLIHGGKFDPAIEQIFAAQRNLVSLDLGRMWLADTSALCAHLPHLQTLCLEVCYRLSNNAIRQIFQMKELKRLCLIGAEKLTDFREILESSQSDLVSLDLGCSYLED